jgi:hypothetical protein
MFMKNIYDTVEYFRSMYLLATFRLLGPPTLFMTLSAEDLELGMSFEDAYGRSSAP